MYRKISGITILSATAALLASCTTMSTLENCGGQARQVTIHYGDSEIRVTPPVIELQRADELKFRLRPDKKASDEVDYDAVMVKVYGKTADDDWIDVSGSSDSTGGSMGVCVPSNQARDTYRYYVEVANVGKIDPRADVR